MPGGHEKAMCTPNKGWLPVKMPGGHQKKRWVLIKMPGFHQKQCYVASKRQVATKKMPRAQQDDTWPAK